MFLFITAPTTALSKFSLVSDVNGLTNLGTVFTDIGLYEHKSLSRDFPNLNGLLISFGSLHNSETSNPNNDAGNLYDDPFISIESKKYLYNSV